MIYVIAFVEKSKLRDTQLERILSDEEDDSVLYNGEYTFLAQVKSKSRPILWWGNGYFYEDRSIASCTKWKTIRGAQSVIKSMNLNNGVSIRGNHSEWDKEKFIPVVYNITEKWNKHINNKIQKEIDSHNRKIINLNKKLG